MFDLYNPKNGTIDRLSVLHGDTYEFTACYRPEVGFYKADSDEHIALSRPGLAHGDAGLAHEYKAYLVAVWPTDDRGRLSTTHLHWVRVKVLIAHRWLAEDIERRAEEFPLNRHDLRVEAEGNGQPMCYLRISPCRQHVASKVEEKEGLVTEAFAAYLAANRAIWETSDPYDLIPSYDIDLLTTLLGLQAAFQTVLDEKREKERAAMPKDALEGVDAMLDGLMDEVEPPLMKPGTDWRSVEASKGRLDQFLYDLKTDPERARHIWRALTS